MTKRVSIEIGGNIIVDADTSKAEEKLKNLNNAVPDTIGHGGKPQDSGVPNPLPPMNSAGGMHNLNQQYFENLAQRMVMSAMSRMTTVRTSGQAQELGDRLERALFNAQQSGNKDLIDTIEDLQGTLEKQQQAIEAARNAPQGPVTIPGQPGQAGPNQGGWWSQVQGMWGKSKPWLGEAAGETALGTLTRYLGGNVGGAVMGGIGKLLGGPAGWVLGGLSAANWAFNAVSNTVTENNALARNEVVGYADLARQYGSNRNFMQLFRDERGWTNDRFARLGYTATQASHVAALYDRPGGMMNDTESILKFSRSMGMDESRTAAAARTLGVVGVGGRDGGNIGEGFRVMKLAMLEGVKEGIAGSDTMNSMLGIAQKAQSEGRSMSSSGLAYYGQIMSRLNNFQSPAMRGQNAGQIASSLLGGLGNQEGDPGMEWFLINSLGKLPSAAKLGLKGEEAKGYDALLKESPIEAGRSLLKHLEKGENPAIAQQVFDAIDKASGGSAVLKKYMYQQLAPGMSDEQLNSLIGGGGAAALFKTNPQDLERRKLGASELEDKQAGNRFANDTMYLRVAEGDRELIKSLASLRLTGGLENRIAELKGSISNLSASIGSLGQTYFQGNGNFDGKVGQGYKDPSNITPLKPADTTANSSYTSGAVTGQDRIQAAIAYKESKFGKDPNTNAPGKSAVGMYQMQSRWLLGKDGWAAQAGVKMTNPDGTPVTTEAQARAWQLANPDKANQIAEHRINAISETIEQVYADKGIDITPNQLAMFTGAIWHRNGGGDLSAATKLPLSSKGNPLNPLFKVRGQLATSAMHLDPNGKPGGKGDGVSDRQYASELAGIFSGPQLGYMPVGSQAVNLRPKSEVMRFTQTFGANKNNKALGYDDRGHLGWDFGIGEAGVGGEDVHSRTDGRVVQAGPNSSWGGITVIVQRDDGFKVLHGHLQSVNVKAGQKVTTNTVIGKEGATGGPAGMLPHLHVEVYNPKGEVVNPSVLFGDPKKKGFRRGGYTGDGPQDEEAGVVHREEWVVDAATTARHRGLLASLSPHGGAPVQRVEVNLGGTINISADLDANSRSEIEAEYNFFQGRVQQIVTGAYSNQRGPR